MDTKAYGLLALRLGMAVTLLFSVATKFKTTEKVANMLGKAGIPGSGEALVIILAVLLIVVSAMLVFGLGTRIAGGFLTLFFIVTLITAFTVGPAVWKDFALLGASLTFLITGGGSVSIDALLSGNKHKAFTSHSDNDGSYSTEVEVDMNDEKDEEERSQES